MVLLLMTSVLILVFYVVGVSSVAASLALFRGHATNNFSAVVNIAYAPNFTTDIGVPSGVGIPAVTDCCSF